MTRQLPVMQLQSFSYPKNVSSLSSPSLTTSSLINNNSLLTFRDIMMHHQYQQQQQQQHHHLQQQLQNQERHQKTENIVNENHFQPATISTASSSSLSPNASAKFSPKHTNYAMETNEKTHPLSINKSETCQNGSKISINRSLQNKSEIHHNNSCAKTVREELEESRNKIPKLGKRKYAHLNFIVAPHSLTHLLNYFVRYNFANIAASEMRLKLPLFVK